MNTISKTLGRTRRHARVRAKVSGTATRPRLSVYKSNRYLHAQLINDEAAKTIVSGSTKELKGDHKKMEEAKLLGAELAKKAQAAGISTVVFDRGGFRYTGRVAALAEAVRKAGIKL